MVVSLCAAALRVVVEYTSLWNAAMASALSSDDASDGISPRILSVLPGASNLSGGVGNGTPECRDELVGGW